ncbi:MAG: class I SAM-dependent methyltransferase [Deltaproteobacteria bacterium]|nr:class I SAM-dependent methyltransferase [Deltaproteobacteria bacterium]
MSQNKFDPKKLEKLNDPRRLLDIRPQSVWNKLDMEKADVLVEIGAGTAFFSIAFFENVKPSTLYACDLSEVMINWVKENVSPKYHKIIPVKTEEHSVPLDDGIADVVYMINLHHELDHPSMTLDEAHRLLKPGGTLFIVDWKKKEMPEGPPVHIRCMPEHVSGQLVNAGFKNVDVFDEFKKHFLVIGKKEH